MGHVAFQTARKTSLTIIFALSVAAAAGCVAQRTTSLTPVGSRTEAVTGVNGIVVNGLGPNGVAVNGIALNSIALNSIALNSIALNSIALNSIALNSIALNSIALNSIALNGVRVDGTTETQVLVSLQQLAACALTTSQTLTVTDLEGTTHVYPGIYGFDPAWNTSVATASQSPAVAQCLVDHYGATFDPQLTIANFKMVMRYLIECALDPSQTATLTDFDGTSIPVQGLFNLAPEWLSGPPTQAGQELVSACLGARTNAAGIHVQISVRGLAHGQDLPVSAPEAAQFTRYEGAFLGDLFTTTSTPFISSCKVQGGFRQSGRLCANPNDTCGFDYLGACPDACTTRDASGNWTDCKRPDGTTSSNVLSTYLPFRSHIAGAGTFAVCARQDDGSAWCWGQNSSGQLGNGATADSYTVRQQVVTAPSTPLTNIAELCGGGYNFACARTDLGQVWCWGDDRHGQLGGGNGTSVNSFAVPVPFPPSSYMTNIAAGTGYACAVRTDGTVWCWGWNAYGQLGDGTTTDRAQPVQVLTSASEPLGGVIKVIAGDHFSCALRVDGSVYCWGKDATGELADGTFVDHRAYAAAMAGSGSTPLADISAAGLSSMGCGLGVDGTAWCWGGNEGGAIGDGTSLPVQGLTRVLNLPPGKKVTQVTAGRETTCATLDDNTLWCWGFNWYGNIGDGTNENRYAVPVQVKGLPPGATIAGVSAGFADGHAVLSDGRIYSWGFNQFGALGDRTTTNKYTAIRTTMVTCGDGVCNNGEDAHTCQADCATPFVYVDTEGSPPSATQVMVTSRLDSPSLRDYVGYFRWGAADNAPVKKVYTQNCSTTAPTSGTPVSQKQCTWSLPETNNGPYSFRLFRGGSTSSVYSTALPAGLDPVVYYDQPTGTVTSYVPAASATDQVGYYRQNAADSSPLGVFYTSSCTATATTARSRARCAYTLPETGNGPYEFRLFANGVRVYTSGLVGASNTPIDRSSFILPSPYPTSGGSWTVTGGTYQQTDPNAGAGACTPDDSPPATPARVMITNQLRKDEFKARVRVDAWDDTRPSAEVGIGVRSDGLIGGGIGIRFTNHMNIEGCSTAVGGRAIEVAWGDGPIYSVPVPYAFSTNTWYWMHVKAVTNNNKVDVYGRVWPDGTREPHAWTIIQTGIPGAIDGYPYLHGGELSTFDSLSYY
jgi:alpha-tubulin suppressor-like RCC1 family protein